MRDLKFKSEWKHSHCEWKDISNSFVGFSEPPQKLAVWIRDSGQHGQIKNQKLNNRDFSGATFGAIAFLECEFTNCRFNANGFGDSVFEDCKFVSCSLGGEMPNGRFLRCRFDECELYDWHHVQMYECSISCCTLGRRLVACDLFQTTISRCDLSMVNFEHCNLAGVKMHDVLMSGATRFVACKSTEGMSVTVGQLAYLDPHDLGGLTPGQRMDMNIRDDVGRLRMAFGGFWLAVHCIALTAFFAPYLAFIAVHYVDAIRNPDFAHRMWLIQGLWNYFLTGGQKWKVGAPTNFWAVATGVVFLAYNILRVGLMWKTLTLELKERVSGLPAKFELLPVSLVRPWKSDFWSSVFLWARILYWAGIGASAIHFWQFLWTYIPVRGER